MNPFSKAIAWGELALIAWGLAGCLANDVPMPQSPQPPSIGVNDGQDARDTIVTVAAEGDPITTNVLEVEHTYSPSSYTCVIDDQVFIGYVNAQFAKGGYRLNDYRIAVYDDPPNCTIVKK